MLPSPMRRTPSWAWAATALIAALLCIATLGPSVPNGGIKGIDKVQHFIGFAVMAFPLCYVWPRHILTIILGVILFGAMIEVLQPFFGREREFADLIADGIGATAGGLLARAVRRRRS